VSYMDLESKHAGIVAGRPVNSKLELREREDGRLEVEG